MEFGEHPEETVHREVREETGLEIDSLKLVDLWSVVSTLGDQQYHVIHFIYRAEVAGGTLRDELDGSTDRCRWFSAEAIDQMPLVELAKRGAGLGFGT